MISLLLSPLVPLVGVALVYASGGRVTGRSAAIAAVVWLAAGFVWFAVLAAVDIAAFQGSVTAAATLVVASLWPGMHRLAIVAWALLVALVVAVASFDVIGGPLVTGLGYVDFGSTGVLGIALGATALVLGRRTESTASPGWRGGVVAAVAAVAGWIGLLVGAELTVDAMTPGILAATGVALITGLVGWLGVELATTRQVSPASIPAGLSAGGLVVAAGAPWLPIPAAAVLGLLAGILAALIARRSSNRLAAITLPASVLGLLATGLLTSGPGWVNSGQPDLLFSELLGAAVIALWTVLVCLPLRWALRRASRVG